eukprot:439502-Pyramimonas_sp.AAC.1
MAQEASHVELCHESHFPQMQGGLQQYCQQSTTNRVLLTVSSVLAMGGGAAHCGAWQVIPTYQA